MDIRYKDGWLMQGDCLEKMKEIPDSSVDMILVDPPYGTTNCKWDSVIDLDLMWKEVTRVCKKDGAIVMTSAQPFTSKLIMSNINMFKYTWVWEKPQAKGHLNAKKRPMVAHEDICVFYKKQPKYFPIKTTGHKRKKSSRVDTSEGGVYNVNKVETNYDSTERYPRSVQTFKQDTQKSSLHPTQKPVGMMEYLIKTYTEEGDTVLDFAMGSGTTGVACANTSRSFIGIEMDSEYFGVASERVHKIF